MRRTLSLFMALLLILSLPMTVLAEVIADTSYGDVNIGDTTVDHYDADGARTDAHEGSVTIVHTNGGQSGTVSVAMDSGTVEVNGDVTGGVEAAGTANVTVNGNVSSDYDGVYANDSSQVTVTGSIDAGYDGVYAEDYSSVTVGGSITAEEDGVDAYGSSQVTVTGNITAGAEGVDAIGSSQVTVTGNVTGRGGGVDAYGNSQVTVDGNVTGGSGDPDAVDYADPEGYSDGSTGVYANDNAKVEVTGSVTGGDSYGTWGYGGTGILAWGNSSVSVGGDVTGGNVIADPNTEAANNEGLGGDGIYMDSTATVTVGGNVTGGSINADSGTGGKGIYIEADGGTPGSVTAGGSVTSGTAENGTDGFGIAIGASSPDADPNDLPAITVGSYDTLVGYGYTDEQMQSIAAAVKVTGLNTPDVTAPVVTVMETKPRQSLQKLLKVESQSGAALDWDELRSGAELTARADEEDAVLIITLEQLQALKKQGVKTIVFKTASCETRLDIGSLIDMNGSEYVLTHKGKTAELTVDGKKTEI